MPKADAGDVPSIIDVDAVIGNGQRGIDEKRLVIAVHGQTVAVCAFRQSADAFERRVARRLDDRVAESIEIGDLEFIHHAAEPATAFVVASGASVDIALDLQRLAHIGANEPQQVFVHPALAGERHDRDRQAFLEYLTAVRSHAKSADVDDMDRIGEQADRFAAIKARRHHGDVVQMSGVSQGSLVM